MRLVKQFARDIENKKGLDFAAAYVRLNQDISKIKPLTGGEREAVLSAIRAALPESDRSKFERIAKLLMSRT
jgi:hypothetical protein